MPAPTTYSPPPPADADIFIRVVRDRIAPAPFAELWFAPSRAVTGKTNTFGGPLYVQVGPPYYLRLDSSRPLALARLAAMEVRGRALCAAGKLLDDAEATLAYELLAECVALNSTAAILAQLGVEVRESNPFPV